MSFLHRIVVLLCLISVGCSAETTTAAGATPELKRRIELQVRSNFSRINPQWEVRVGDFKPSEFPGYHLVPVTVANAAQETTVDFLVSHDGKTMLNMTKWELADPMSNIKTEGRPFLGGNDAKVVLVNYDNLQCPACTSLHNTLRDHIVPAYGDRIKLIYKDFPLEQIHPWAVRGAVNANCLAAQNSQAYWEFVDYAHREQRTISTAGSRDAQFKLLDDKTMEMGRKHGADPGRLQQCIARQDESAVRASLKEGEALGVEATPTMFVNGERVGGALPPELLRAIIDRALRHAGQEAPQAASR